MIIKFASNGRNYHTNHFFYKNLTGRIVTQPYFQAISFPYYPRPRFFVLPVHALKANLTARREAACLPQILLYNCENTVLDSYSFTPETYMKLKR